RSHLPYTAVHSFADTLADTRPASPAAIDWEHTLAFRRHIWKYGLGVAEAMDTAQRGMGLDWEASKELIRRSVAEAKAVGGRIVCGAQTDHLAHGSARDLRDIEAAYEEQCEYVEKVGGQVVVMASRELARIARGPDDYARVYGRVLSQLKQLALDEGDDRSFHQILEPTLPLSRHVFGAPTFYYKTGVVFMAYLNGHQDHFRMVGGLESGRSAVHLANIFVLADKAGLLRDAELAVDRIRPVMAVAGVS